MVTLSSVGASGESGADNQNEPEGPTSQAHLHIRAGEVEVLSSASGAQVAILVVVVAIIAIVVSPAVTTYFLASSWSGLAMGGVVLLQLVLEFSLGWLVYKFSLRSGQGS